jgi:hypothetical protein
MFVRVPVPLAAGPVWGFDFPVQDRFHVATAQGFLEIVLAPHAQVNLLLPPDELQQLFDPATEAELQWNGRRYDVNGPNGPAPTLLDLPCGDHITGDSQAGRLLITDPEEREIRQEILFGPPAGGWIVAGFSEDGKYLIIGDGEKVWAFRREA